MAELNYKVDEKDTEQSFDPVPAGEYLVIIENSDFMENKQATGQMLKLTYQIIDGPFKGRKLFNNLNLVNTSKQAEQIARQTLNSIGVACGVLHIKDSAQLHNIPIKVDVGVKDDATYGLQNRIKKHKALDGAAPAVAAPPAQEAVKSPEPAVNGNGGKGKKPWEK